jgi:hypothetical protein
MRTAIVATVLFGLLLASVPPAPAGEVAVRRHRQHVRPELYLDLPLDYDTAVIFPFGGSHHAVPGVVSIDRQPYRCLAHERAFRERIHFVVHLRREHGLADDQIPAAVVVDRGEVIYLGD